MSSKTYTQFSKIFKFEFYRATVNNSFMNMQSSRGYSVYAVEKPAKQTKFQCDLNPYITTAIPVKLLLTELYIKSLRFEPVYNHCDTSETLLLIELYIKSLGVKPVYNH